MTVIYPTARLSRRTPIAACVASVFALSTPIAALADTWLVNDCSEGSSGDMGLKTGTLRFALTNATNPAVINLTTLTACPSSKISLTTGALKFNQGAVTINGPGSSILAIDAAGLTAGPTYMGNPYGYQRVFSHYGTGTLKVQNLTVTGGHSYRGSLGYTARGGCIFSNGKVELVSSSVTNCFAKHADSNVARGGAVYAAGAFTMSASTVSDSFARSDTGGASGGGVFAVGDITLTSISSVHDNEAKSASSDARGGGLMGMGNATVTSTSFVHTNSATCTANGIAKGGGIYTVLNTELSASSAMKYNSATSAMNNARGGGAFVSGNLTLAKSSMYGNSATSAAFGAVGGAAYVSGDFASAFSTISGNAVSGGTFVAAGGLDLFGNVTISNTTISGNTSSAGFAGMDVFSLTPGTKSFVMRNSTISGNSAGTEGGAFYVNSGTVKIYNSTIAFNTAVQNSPGVHLSAAFAPMAVTLQSTLISNNTYGANENDLTAINQASITFNAGPANNLIRATGVTGSTGLPGDTLFTDCPLLGPLRDNGGLTNTHTVQSKSPAIDSGNDIGIDPITMLPFAYDQRGSAADNGSLDYLRISGPKADIGAHEVQQDDVIFDSGHEGCIDLN